jgi:glutathione S-transferase
VCAGTTHCAGILQSCLRRSADQRGKQTDPAYLAINPLGRVPSLVTSTHGTITEAPAVLSYIADLAPGLRLLQPPGNPDRYQALRWMAYISSTVHPALGRFWRAERFCDDASCAASIQHAAATQLADDFAYIERHMSAREWIVGDHLTVADLHLFVFDRLGLRFASEYSRFSRLPQAHAKNSQPSSDAACDGPARDCLGGPGLRPGLATDKSRAFANTVVATDDQVRYTMWPIGISEVLH